MTSRGESHQLSTKMDVEASERALWGQWLAVKPEDLGLISRTHITERESQLFFFSTCHLTATCVRSAHTVTCAPRSPHPNTE